MLSQSDRALHVKQVYSELDRKFEEEETQIKAEQQSLPYFNLYGFPVDAQALKLLPKAQALASGTAIFYKEGRVIKLGMIEDGAKVNKVIQDLTDQCYTVDEFFISQSSFKHLLEGY